MECNERERLLRAVAVRQREIDAGLQLLDAQLRGDDCGSFGFLLSPPARGRARCCATLRRARVSVEFDSDVNRFFPDLETRIREHDTRVAAVAQEPAQLPAQEMYEMLKLGGGERGIH